MINILAEETKDRSLESTLIFQTSFKNDSVININSIPNIYAEELGLGPPIKTSGHLDVLLLDEDDFECYSHPHYIIAEAFDYHYDKNRTWNRTNFLLTGFIMKIGEEIRFVIQKVSLLDKEYDLVIDYKNTKKEYYEAISGLVETH